MAVERRLSVRIAALAALLFLASALLACEHKPLPGEEVSSACHVENDGKTTTVSGYLQAPILIGCETKSCSFQVTPTRSGDYGLRIDIPLGSGANTMTPLAPSKHAAIPGQITAENVSVSIRDASGTDVRVRDVVRVTGKMSAYASSDGKLNCALDVQKLERL